jgi:hypothetical protein
VKKLEPDYGQKRASLDNATEPLRRYPYPYKSLLAIASDLDGTPDWTSHRGLIEFLNTDYATPFGCGVSLEFANSLYFLPAPGDFGYYSSPPNVRSQINQFIESRHIDTLHSYGDSAFERSHVERVLSDLHNLKARIPVWIDHARALTNFGHYGTRGFGDVPQHAAYHADISVDYGIDHVWRGQVTVSVCDATGFRPSIIARQYRRGSGLAIPLGKELAKIALGSIGYGRYRLHRCGRVCERVALRDGQLVNEFIRYNSYSRGINQGDSADKISQVLSGRVIETLISNSAAIIVYTHLGQRFPMGGSDLAELRRTFENIKRRELSGDLRVLTTSRLLDYLALRESVRVHRSVANSCECIAAVTEPDDRVARRALRRGGGEGLSFYVSTRGPYRLTINGSEVRNFRENPADETGRRSLSLNLPRLEFPDV